MEAKAEHIIPLAGVLPVIAENGIATVDRVIDVVKTLSPVDCPVTHRFAPGMYIRELHVPKGTLVVTKLHKTEHPYVVSKGKMSVWTAESGVVHITAPHTGITQPGTRRVAFAHEDTIWTTFHCTTKTDVDEIESDIIEPTRETVMVQADVMAQLKENL